MPKLLVIIPPDEVASPMRSDIRCNYHNSAFTYLPASQERIVIITNYSQEFCARTGIGLVVAHEHRRGIQRDARQNGVILKKEARICAFRCFDPVIMQ